MMNPPEKRKTLSEVGCWSTSRNRARIGPTETVFITEVYTAVGAEASADFVSIDDPMATYGQKNVPVSVAPKKAPIVNVDVEFPFSVKTMDCQRWMS
jgi:hypothetical protein